MTRSSISARRHAPIGAWVAAGIIAAGAAGIVPVSAANAAPLPGPPTGVIATAGPGSATVSWTAPADPGSSAVVSYTAQALSGGTVVAGRTCETHFGQLLSCTITKLTAGVPYTFVVAARNGSGLGPNSTPSAPVIPTPPPASAPIVTKVVFTSGSQMRVKFKPGPIAATSFAYRVSKSASTRSKWSAWKSLPASARSITVQRSLAKGARFRLRATNAIGNSAVVQTIGHVRLGSLRSSDLQSPAVRKSAATCTLSSVKSISYAKTTGRATVRFNRIARGCAMYRVVVPRIPAPSYQPVNDRTTVKTRPLLGGTVSDLQIMSNGRVAHIDLWPPLIPE